MFSVVVQTPDVVGERMAGPGIRAWQLARQLAAIAPTTLVARIDSSPDPRVPVTLVQHGTAEAEDALREAAVIVGQPARGLGRRRRSQKLVADLFDPTVLELRELYGNKPSLRQRVHVGAEWWRLSEAMLTADLLIYAAPKQREFYSRLQGADAPWIHVPFGVDLDEVADRVAPENDLLIWGGGVWEWLDPGTAIDAVLKLNADGTPCRMLFLGKTRPNRDLIDRRRDDRFTALLEHGNGFVSANEEWVPYRERLSWLRSGRATIMLHRATVEAQYSIRTRLFDSMAAAVPVIATTGGYAASLIESEGLGIVVPAGDSGAVAAAGKKLLEDDAFHSRCVLNLERTRTRFEWGRVARPLIAAVEQWRTGVH